MQDIFQSRYTLHTTVFQAGVLKRNLNSGKMVRSRFDSDLTTSLLPSQVEEVDIEAV